MARIFIDKICVLSYDATPRGKYWAQLSKYLIDKYGKNIFTEHDKVESLLVDCFQYLVNEFRIIIQAEPSFTFYQYLFFLHEESIKLYIKIMGGFKLEKIDANELAIYRRVLKLIIEQGCESKLEWGHQPSVRELKLMDEKIQKLLYLGTWMYGFADLIAFQKMIERCHSIYFDEEDLLVVDWQYHYGKMYNNLFPLLRKDYAHGVVDEAAVQELITAISNGFGIDYSFAVGMIFNIKEHFNPDDPTFQTIQPEILPRNLVLDSGISQEIAEKFYAGLSISKQNKLSLEDAILKPYSTFRYMYRPILIFNIEGEARALVGEQKFAESIMVLATNALHWNTMHDEWLSIKAMQRFVNKKGLEHDKILEDKIENIIKEKGFLYCRNIKTFKQFSGVNIRIDNELAGEIDSIVVNVNLKKIFVADAKYNKSKYEAVGYRSDNTNFIKSYEPQLKKKLIWITNNLQILQDHLRITFRIEDLIITDYSVEGVFFINTPTFYMFNGEFKAITINNLSDFLDGHYEYPSYLADYKSDGVEYSLYVNHPYFKKPELQVN